MSKIKVSIIVPTYNGQEVLRKAVDSLLSQTLDSYEIILADDCSTDNTREIINDYAKNFPEKIIVNNMKFNTRGSGVINASVGIARGKYIATVDQDDWVDNTMYEKLYNAAEKAGAEIADCNCCKVDSFGNLIEESESTPERQTGNIDDAKRRALFVNPGMRLTKIFRKDFLLENNIKHPDNVCYGDNYFMEHIAAYCNKIAKVDESLYYYRIDTESITRSYNNPITYDRVKSAELMMESLTQLGFLDKYREEIEFRFIELFYVNSIHAFTARFQPCEIKEITYLRSTVKQKYRNYRKNKYFKERISKRDKLITMLCDISPSLLCKAYTCYRSLKA